jgi:alkylation response protein AidB-like acyl-CoA dehydrogenase
LRITTAIAPTGQAVPVDGGYRVTGQWAWSTAGGPARAVKGSVVGIV